MSNSNKTVLVTGGAGYIGSQVAADLLQSGYQVVVIDNLCSGRRELVPDAAEFVEGDIHNVELMEKLFLKFRFGACLHFAAHTRVDESVVDPLKYYQNNTVGTLRILQMLQKFNVPRLVFSSTAAVYGNTSEKKVREDMVLNPVSPYGKSKLFSEHLIRDFAQAAKLNFVILRYFNVAGADPNGARGQRTPYATHLIKVACEVAAGKREALEVYGTDYPTQDGTCVRDYIHVVDLSRAHLLSLKHLEAGGSSDVFNVGYGKGYSVREVVNAFRPILGESLAVRYVGRRAGDIAEIIADNKKIREELGFQPKYDDIDFICRSALQYERSL